MTQLHFSREDKYLGTRHWHNAMRLYPTSQLRWRSTYMDGLKMQRIALLSRCPVSTFFVFVCFLYYALSSPSLTSCDDQYTIRTLLFRYYYCLPLQQSYIITYCILLWLPHGLGTLYRNTFGTRLYFACSAANWRPFCSGRRSLMRSDHVVLYSSIYISGTTWIWQCTVLYLHTRRSLRICHHVLAATNWFC